MVPIDNVQDDDMSHIERHVWEFARDQFELTIVASEIKLYLEELAQAASIPLHAVESRAKGLKSYENKTSKVTKDGSRRYLNPAKEIHDCVAARVLLYTTSAQSDLSALISKRTDVFERKFPGDSKHNGYDSEHLVITGLKEEDAKRRYPHLVKYFAKYPGLEIQLRSVAAHAWAEYEHDIRYKTGGYHALSRDRREQIDQWFVEAGGMRKVMDDLFGRIEKELLVTENVTSEEAEPEAVDIEGDVAPDAAAPLDAASLTRYISTRHPATDVGESADIAELVTHLSVIGVQTLGQLEASLGDLELGSVATLMDYPSQVSGARRLDDEILSVIGDRYVDSASDSGRADLLRLRLRRVKGKFAVYSMSEGEVVSRAVTAARAVRQLVERVASRVDLSLLRVEGFVSPDRGELNPSMKAATIKTESGPVYVSTNMTRAAAESVMRNLVRLTGGEEIQVLRAGDLIFPPPHESNKD